MNLDKQECRLVAEALQLALQNNSDPDKARRYRELLERVQSRGQVLSPAFEDGFRYDYDDSSQV
ncbi:hypothetical protein [Desmospora profundinema]|uniref:Uncharacterized protein n=1 Tax=Desmospora profundinema TaxID=1571184 RepID=A0ABU1IPR7_9BACL|nr:hypothetical protein [Desmospora profundinema]MDR6225745.1 hypothetical protein [Desmospora profundinema]